MSIAIVRCSAHVIFVLGIRNPRGNTLNNSDLGTGVPKTQGLQNHGKTKNTEILKIRGYPKHGNTQNMGGTQNTGTPTSPL